MTYVYFTILIIDFSDRFQDKSNLNDPGNFTLEPYQVRRPPNPEKVFETLSITGMVKEERVKRAMGIRREKRAI